MMIPTWFWIVWSLAVVIATKMALQGSEDDGQI